MCDDLYTRIAVYYIDKLASGKDFQGDLCSQNFIYGTRPGETEPRPYFFDVEPRNTSFAVPAPGDSREDTHEHALDMVYELTKMINEAERTTGHTLTKAREKTNDLVSLLTDFQEKPAVRLSRRNLGLDDLDAI